MIKINDPNHPVILFIPEAGIYPYIRGLSVLGDAVRKQGGNVFVTHDTGQMLRSPIMAMYRTSVGVSVKERAKILKVTERYIKSVLSRYQFSSIELSDFVDGRLIKEINSLANIAGENLKKVNFRGFPVGRIAKNDFMLETKYPYYSKLSKAHKALYKQYIKNTALSLAVTEAICKRYKPSLILTFNEYAQCQAVRYGAKKCNVRRMALTYPVHFNIDASRFSIWESTYDYWINKHCQKWDEWKNVPIDKQFVKECWNDSVFRMYSAGSHIFSTRKGDNPADIFKNLKLDPNRKTIIVYTTSQDERTGVDISMKVWDENGHIKDSFVNQIEWLSWLRSYALKRKDVQIVVRVHPREGLRQFGFASRHLIQLKAKFKKNTPNFIIVWPDDPISSYDLMELADVCLVAWSTIGQEAARVGIPVLSCTGNMFYPNDDFIQTATTPKEYKKKLDTMLLTRYTWRYLIKAVRFYHWRTFIPSLDLGRTVPRYYDDDGIWPKAPASMVGVLNDVLSGKQDLIKYNLKVWRKSLPEDALFQETQAMKWGIRYLLDSVFYPPPSPKRVSILFLIVRRIWREITGKNIPIIHTQKQFNDYQLKYTDDTSQLEEFIKKTKRDPNLRILIADGLQATLIHKGNLLTRMSPMVIRLAKLHESN